MKMKDIKSIVYWIIGFLLADGFRYLLRDVDIPEIFKWALGIVIILGGYILIIKLFKKDITKEEV
ncbi:MAG: hypothetical protein E7215_04440 [Clostridium sulfidigenes]|uniref:Uncharacterized protein n=1 Tax=Clostridium sulfidigenes TaxID=318464 RepID=A0A927W8Z9_9CLOT|nr:hypothetical protein [Clostridium sulfidigenes]